MGPDGVTRTLAEQDRARWRHDEIAEGLAELDAALAVGRPGPYQVQAAVAALHDQATDAAATDWPQILGLYDVLLDLTGSPVVALNRAVAVAEVRGAEAGLAALDAVADEPALAEYHLLPAVRAELLVRAGRPADAAVDLRRALALVDREGERRLLERRLTDLPSRARPSRHDIDPPRVDLDDAGRSRGGATVGHPAAPSSGGRTATGPQRPVSA